MVEGKIKQEAKAKDVDTLLTEVANLMGVPCLVLLEIDEDRLIHIKAVSPEVDGLSFILSEKAKEIIEEVLQEEEEKLDNMYDSFSETERYSNMEEKKDTLEEIKDQLEEIIQ